MRILSQVGILCNVISCITAITLNIWLMAEGSSVRESMPNPYVLTGSDIEKAMGMLCGLLFVLREQTVLDFFFFALQYS